MAVEELPENAVAKAQGQFGNTEKGERLPSEADTGGLLKSQLTEKTEECVDSIEP
jgi:hypothetical protein